MTQTTDYSGKTLSYEYDLCGNRTRLTYPDSSYITYQYDQLNRLTAIKDPAGASIVMTPISQGDFKLEPAL